MDPAAQSHLRSLSTTALLAFAIASIVGAPSLDRWAQRKSDGLPRRLASWLVRPAVASSRALGVFALRERAGRRIYAERLPDYHGAPSATSEPEPPAPPLPIGDRPRSGAPEALPIAPDERRYDRARPLRVWVAGDSMAFHFGLQLERMARRSGVMRVALDSQPSTGLIDRGDVQWHSRLQVTLEQRRPHVFVLSFGANDADVLRHHGVAYAPGRSEWRDGYRERTRAIMELIGSRRPVYWLGMPVMRSAQYAQKIAVMNAVFVEEAARVPSVRFIDTVPRYSAADGSFAAFLPDASGRLRLVRMEDGIHYTPEGARQLAAHVFEMLCARFIVGGRCP